MKKQLSWKWFDHRTDLPTWLKAGIGQIVAEWSVLERELEETVQALLDVEIALSRIVVNSMQARNRIFVIDYLVEWCVYHDKLDHRFADRFTKLASRITSKTQAKRDMVAHGLWTKRDGKWYVLRLRASRKTPELRPDFEKVSRPVVPQRVLVTREMVASIAEDIIYDAKELQAFCAEVYAALSPSRYKPLQYSRRRQKTAKKTARRARP
ncbi:hypothetical protein [Bradyrhizobium sp. AZCC 2289]|uniref:hypothetical protein n=1 Tax=Bradyrhizobium sp. AZCC 2289 TaxID=3117026 RepID=UPI002FF30A34